MISIWIFALTLSLPHSGQAGKQNRETLHDWIKGEVRYLITEEERSVYERLTSAEEREHFIEEFWRRRDTNPATPDNEFREEFYRRIAYANENFRAGGPGWLTDRGRVYVLYGPPDRRDAHPMGGRYQKPANMGGDTVTTFPFEIWEYNYIPGIGQDITIEFVDRSGSGMYVLTTDSNQKDVFYWRRGEMPRQRIWARAKEMPFERMRVWARIQSPPPLRFPSLREEVKAAVSYDNLPFEVGTSFVRMSEDSYAIPITVTVPNDKLDYAGLGGYFQADLQLYISATDLNGATVYQVDEAFEVKTSGESLPDLLKRPTYHQRVIPLPPGRYRMNIVLKDVNSGKVGVRDAVVWIPQVSDTGLNTSSLIYADVIQPAPEGSRGEEFVIGPLKVVPNLKGAFLRQHRLGLYLEVYDLELDRSTEKPSVEISYALEGPDGRTLHFGGEMESRFPEGRSMAVAKAIPLDNLAPGKYRVTVRVSDALTGRQCTLEGRIEVL
ncbi:MAG: GWxTD domain-containing protein [Acidobacteria bacterium]|nr:GWxTD domain-containing protein [Acidobacteriota bacterium]